MITSSKFYAIVVLLLVAFCLQSHAQFSSLYGFGSSLDGTLPLAAPITDDTWIYGTTLSDGVKGNGTLYKIKPDGTGYTKMVDFDGTIAGSVEGSLLLYNGVLYGMGSGGGTNGIGSIFKIKTDGTSLSVVFSFDNTTTGANPLGALITDGTYFYGVTNSGGTAGSGNIFRINLDGSNFTVLQALDGTNTGNYGTGPLYSDGTWFYGVLNGSYSFYGKLFRIKPGWHGVRHSSYV